MPTCEIDKTSVQYRLLRPAENYHHAKQFLNYNPSFLSAQECRPFLPRTIYESFQFQP
jgi:hypothetical protein